MKNLFLGVVAVSSLALVACGPADVGADADTNSAALSGSTKPRNPEAFTSCTATPVSTTKITNVKCVDSTGKRSPATESALSSAYSQHVHADVVDSSASPTDESTPTLTIYLVGELGVNKNFTGGTSAQRYFYVTQKTYCNYSNADPAGESDLREMGINDKTSAIWIRSGCGALAWRDINFKGPDHLWKKTTNYVGDTWNDKISSVIFDGI